MPEASPEFAVRLLTGKRKKEHTGCCCSCLCFIYIALNMILLFQIFSLLQISPTSADHQTKPFCWSHTLDWRAKVIAPLLKISTYVIYDLQLLIVQMWCFILNTFSHIVLLRKQFCWLLLKCFISSWFVYHTRERACWYLTRFMGIICVIDLSFSQFWVPCLTVEM